MHHSWFVASLYLFLSCHYAAVYSVDLTTLFDKCVYNGSYSEICDVANIFNASDDAKLKTLINDTKKSVCTDCATRGCATNPSLYFYIVTIDNSSLDASNVTQCGTYGKSIVDTLRSNWTGSPCGNDILLLISVCSRKSYLSIGTIANDRLPLNCQNMMMTQVNFYIQALKMMDAAIYSLNFVRDNYRNPNDLSASLPTCFARDSDLPTYVWVLIGLTILLGVFIVTFFVYQCTAYRRRLYLNYHPENFIRFYHSSNEKRIQEETGSVIPYHPHDFSGGADNGDSHIPGAAEEWVGGSPAALPGNSYRQFYSNSTEMHAVEGGSASPYFVNPTYRA